MTGSIPLIFLLGALIGMLAGGALCVRYLRQEIAADIGPRLRRMQLQLDSLESALNLVLVTRYAEIGSQLPPEATNRSLGGGGSRREHLPADAQDGPSCPQARAASDRRHRPSASRTGLDAPSATHAALPL
jgi:hypothetical protein